MSCRSVSTSKAPPTGASFCASEPAVSAGSMDTLSWSSMGPVSIPSSISIVVMPVSRSPLMTAHWMGAAPRYFGSKEPWTFTQPRGGMSRMILGRIRPNAVTAIKSGFQARRASRNSGAFIFSGCRMGSRCWRASTLMGEGVKVCPRPFGRSGCVTTPTTWSSDRSKASSDGTAKSGVPMKTIRMGLL